MLLRTGCLLLAHAQGVHRVYGTPQPGTGCNVCLNTMTRTSHVELADTGQRASSRCVVQLFASEHAAARTGVQHAQG
jgi:hypothetical protein